MLDRNTTLLFSHVERRYTYFLRVTPLVEEALLVPFYVGGEAVGTIWVVAHDEARKFDAEDELMMGSLGKFASSAYQILASIGALESEASERQKAERATSLLAAVAGAVAADAVFDSQRTTADGGDRLQQRAVPLVCGIELGRRGVDATTFTKNRDRLLEAEVAEEFLARVVERARSQGLTSDEHFTVDGTFLEAWAGAKSFQQKNRKTPPPDDPGNPTLDRHGEKRINETPASKTDPDAQMARKSRGKEAKLSYSGKLLVKSQIGLIVDAEVFEANGTAERHAALVMLEQIPGTKPVTVGGDKGYDTADFVAECRHRRVTPHVAQNDGRKGESAIDTRTTRHAGYTIS